MARVSETGGGETGDGAGARILAAVRSALIGRADLARRPRYTADEWAALTREEKKACSGIGIAAVRQVPEDVYDQIDELGRLRYEPAVPSLIEVWEHCPGHRAACSSGC